MFVRRGKDQIIRQQLLAVKKQRFVVSPAMFRLIENIHLGSLRPSSHWLIRIRGSFVLGH